MSRTVNLVSVMAIFTILMLGLSIVASASPTEATFVGHGNGLQIYSRYYGGNIYSGIFQMQVNGVTYDGYCIDLYAPISVGQTLEVNGHLTEDARTNIEWSAVGFVLNTYKGINNLEAAAIQAAVWYFVSAPFGAYPGTGGKWQFMTDPMTNNYDGYYSTSPNSQVRDRAFQMINSVPRDGTGKCTYRFPWQITLEPPSASVVVPPVKQVILTATVKDPTNNPVVGVTVNFEKDKGALDKLSGATDINGQIQVTFTTTNTSPDSANVRAYINGIYGTLLRGDVYEPKRQSVTIPYSIEDSSVVNWKPPSVGGEAELVTSAASSYLAIILTMTAVGAVSYAVIRRKIR